MTRVVVIVEGRRVDVGVDSDDPVIIGDYAGFTAKLIAEGYTFGLGGTRIPPKSEEEKKWLVNRYLTETQSNELEHDA
jgi:hypothetical protein